MAPTRRPLPVGVKLLRRSAPLVLLSAALLLGNGPWQLCRVAPSSHGQSPVWQDLFDNPRQWVDWREAKNTGKVKPNHPDFKDKTKGVSLWLSGSSTPAWVKERLKAGDAAAWKLGSSTKANEKELAWKRLFEEPIDWVDWRAAKVDGTVRSTFPDFKNEATGESLWLDGLSTPAWVQERLEVGEMLACKLGSSGMTHMSIKSGDREVMWKNLPEEHDKSGHQDMKSGTRAAPSDEEDAADEDLWHDLLGNYENWLDIRPAKASKRVSSDHADFWNKLTNQQLWMAAAPSWVLPQLEDPEPVPTTNVQENAADPTDFEQRTEALHAVWDSVLASDLDSSP